MKNYQKLFSVPLGSVTAEGFLKEQLIRSKNGMGGYLDKLAPSMIASPYVNKQYVKNWDHKLQSGWGAEISGNYWCGLINLAYTLNDAELIEKATNWVNSMMKNQREDGYLGTFYEPDARIYDDFNAWGTACGMRALLAFYEATGREDVMNAVYHCMLWFTENWDGDKKTSYCGPYITEPMIRCYHHTHDQRLLQFCLDYAEFLCKRDLFHISYKAFLEEKLEFNSNHTVAYGCMSRVPAYIYSATGDEKFLRASERILSQIREKANHITGSPVSMSEFLGPVGSTTECEYCSYANYQQTYAYMGNVTAETKYGDYMEEMFYNGAQGARKKDERAIAYFSAPNQIFASTYSSSSQGTKQRYDPCFVVSCCPANSVPVPPEFIANMFMTDKQNNVYIKAYGPCKYDYNGNAFHVDTMYPFREKLEFEFDKDSTFTLNLKIPFWCKDYTVLINGEAVSTTEDNCYIAVTRNWKKGDKLTLTLKMQTEVLRIDDSYCAKKYPLAIRRGPLVYSLHLKENWIPVETKTEVHIDGFQTYSVYPEYDFPEIEDPQEIHSYRKFYTPFNFALDPNLSPDEIKVEEVENTGYVWEDAPVKLHLDGYRALFLCAPYAERTFEPYGDKQTVGEKAELTLEPYGCTNLRITYFPLADLENSNL